MITLNRHGHAPGISILLILVIFLVISLSIPLIWPLCILGVIGYKYQIEHERMKPFMILSELIWIPLFLFLCYKFQVNPYILGSYFAALISLLLLGRYGNL